jgi:hypothetical protein
LREKKPSKCKNIAELFEMKGLKEKIPLMKTKKKKDKMYQSKVIPVRNR